MCHKCESCGCNMTEFEANISPICDSCFDNEVPPVCGNYDGEDDNQEFLQEEMFDEYMGDCGE